MLACGGSSHVINLQQGWCRDRIEHSAIDLKCLFVRILIVHNTLNDSKSLSGALRHYLYMADEWTKAGHQTDFLAAEAGRPQISTLAPLSRFISSDPFFNATRHVQATWR